MTAPMTDGHDRRITIVMALSAVVAFLVLYGTPTVIRTSNAAHEVQRGNDLAACRSSYAAQVTEARTAFDIARSQRDSADAEADVVVLELAIAAIFGDDDTVARLRDRLPAMRQVILDRNADVADADDALIAANDIYQAALERSRSDPDGFLAACKEDG